MDGSTTLAERVQESLPVGIVTALLAVLFGAAGAIVPRFRGMFVEMDVELPVLTAIVIRAPWLWWALSLAVVVAGSAVMALIWWPEDSPWFTMPEAGRRIVLVSMVLTTLGLLGLGAVALFLPLITLMGSVGG